jgi:predicted PurR-regulated permease PerM
MYSRLYTWSFVIGTVVVLGWLLLKFLDPFWAPLGWAAILAFLLFPLHKRLTKKLRGRAGYSAGILTGLTPFFIILPVVGFGVVFAQQVTLLIEYLRKRQLGDYRSILSRVSELPVVGRVLGWFGADVGQTFEQIETWFISGAQSLLKGAATMGGSLAIGVVGTLVSFFLMLFLLFFLLRDGQSMLMHLMRLVPMNPERRGRLLHYLSDVARAVIFGNALTAVIQGTMVGIGFAIVKLPSPVVFAVLGAITAFIPAAGTGFVLVPATLYLAASGRWGAAIFLAVWTAIVGVMDNVLRPFLTQQRASVSTLTVFVGVLGGVAAFGFVGSLIGPVFVALVVALLRFAEQEVEKPKP